MRNFKLGTKQGENYCMLTGTHRSVKKSMELEDWKCDYMKAETTKAAKDVEVF